MLLLDKNAKLELGGVPLETFIELDVGFEELAEIDDDAAGLELGIRIEELGGTIELVADELAGTIDDVFELDAGAELLAALEEDITMLDDATTLLLTTFEELAAILDENGNAAVIDSTS